MAHADVAADQPAAVIASVRRWWLNVVGRLARDRRPGDFVVDVMTSALEPDEILVEIKLPSGRGGIRLRQAGKAGWSHRLRRGGCLRLGGRRERDHRGCPVALTGVGHQADACPWRDRGHPGSRCPTDDAIGSRATAAEGVTVLEDLYGSVEYKTHLAKVLSPAER